MAKSVVVVLSPPCRSPPPLNSCIYTLSGPRECSSSRDWAFFACCSFGDDARPPSRALCCVFADSHGVSNNDAVADTNAIVDAIADAIADTNVVADGIADRDTDANPFVHSNAHIVADTVGNPVVDLVRDGDADVVAVSHVRVLHRRHVRGRFIHPCMATDVCGDDGDACFGCSFPSRGRRRVAVRLLVLSNNPFK